LKKLDNLLESRGAEIHRMGWIEFQMEAFRRLASKDESQWPQNEVWITSTPSGKTVKLEV